MAVLIGIALILDISFIIAWYLNVLVSLYRIRQTNGSYTLMLSQGICDLTGLIQYLWLSIEIATDLMLPISARWSSFLFYTNWLTEYFHYICIGLCRADALINVMAYSVRWKYRYCTTLLVWKIINMFKITFFPQKFEFERSLKCELIANRVL
jgi:hypothetical protein